MKLQATVLRGVSVAVLVGEAALAVRTHVPARTKLPLGGDWGDGPAPAPTECPIAKQLESGEGHLLKRTNNAKTCGWFGDVPFSCAGTSTCTTSFRSIIGCCGSGQCNLNSVCLPLTSSSAASFYDYARVCTEGADTACITAVFVGPSTTYTAFGCDSEFGFLAGSIYRSGEGPSDTSTTTTSSTSSSAISSTSTTTTSTPTATPAPQKESNAGAIAGGVVGGVAVLAIIIGGIIYFCMTKKNSTDSHSARHQSAMAGPQGPSQDAYQQNSGGYYLPQAGPAPAASQAQQRYSVASNTAYMSPVSTASGAPLMKDYHGNPISPAASGMTSPHSATSPYGYAGTHPMNHQNSYPNN